MEGESNRLTRVSPLKIDPPQFRRLGYEVVDHIASLLESLPTRPVTRGESPLDIRKALEEGFKDRQKFLKEPEFMVLREDPEFQQLMATEQKVL